MFAAAVRRRHRSVEAVATQSCALTMELHPCGSCAVKGGGAGAATPRPEEARGEERDACAAAQQSSQCKVNEVGDSLTASLLGGKAALPRARIVKVLVVGPAPTVVSWT